MATGTINPTAGGSFASNSALAAEATTRANADTALAGQIAGKADASDVVSKSATGTQTLAGGLAATTIKVTGELLALGTSADYLGFSRPNSYTGKPAGTLGIALGAPSGGLGNAYAATVFAAGLQLADPFTGGSPVVFSVSQSGSLSSTGTVTAAGLATTNGNIVGGGALNLYPQTGSPGLQIAYTGSTIDINPTDFSKTLRFYSGGYTDFRRADGNTALRVTAAGEVQATNALTAGGDVEVSTISKGVILKSPDGTRYRLTVANGGTLTVAAV